MTTDRERFLAERRKGIGGSDVAAILGINPWRTPLDVWRSKVLGESDEENAAMHWGTVLEPVILAEMSKRLGKQIINNPPMMVDGWKLANLDGLIPGEAIVEAKTSRSDDGWGDEGTDDIPDHYQTQVQHYLDVAGLQVAHVGVLIGGSDFRLYTVKRNDVVIAKMGVRLERFWRVHVLTETPPPPCNLADAKALWHTEIAGKSKPVEPVLELLERREVRRRQIKALEDEGDSDETVLRCYMEDAEALVDCYGNPLFTMKKQQRKRYAVPPEVQAQYEVEPSEFRVGRLTKYWTKRQLTESKA